MKSFTTYLAVAAAALVTGGLVATSLNKPADPVKPTALRAPIVAPEQVRTQVVTRVIHRVHRVHVHPKPHHPAVAAAAPPAPAPVVHAAPAPAPVIQPRRVVVAQHIPTPTTAPAHPTTKPTLSTRTSGHGTGSSGGGEDNGERGDNSSEDHYEGGDD